MLDQTLMLVIDCRLKTCVKSRLLCVIRVCELFLGPTKLFLLVQAPASLNLPLHFLVKREIRENKKVSVIIRSAYLLFLCRSSLVY